MKTHVKRPDDDDSKMAAKLTSSKSHWLLCHFFFYEKWLQWTVWLYRSIYVYVSYI